MGTHPIFESDFDCLTDRFVIRTKWHLLQSDREIRLSESVLKGTLPLESRPSSKFWKRHLKLRTGKSHRNRSVNGPKLMANRKKMEKNHYLTSSIQIQSDGLTLLNHSHSCPDSISKRSVLEGFHKCHAQSTSAAYTVASTFLLEIASKPV